MSDSWAERERNTNRLVRALAAHVFSVDEPGPDRLYGLAKLTWITKGASQAYITSTKIPALGDVFGEDFHGMPLDEVAVRCEQITRDPLISNLVQCNTGFTDFYNAYRNSAREWVAEHYAALLDIYRRAFHAVSHDARALLIAELAGLPDVPKANHPNQLLRVENYVTPVLFSLDPQIKFPIINKRDWVQNLLRDLKVSGAPLGVQFQAMSQLIGTPGIDDAADLDRVGVGGNRVRSDIADFVSVPNRPAIKAFMDKKETSPDKLLPLKDESDVQAIKDSLQETRKRKHNKMTNAFRRAIGETIGLESLCEGVNQECMFDIQVKNYDGENDLLIEAKSAADSASIRMAVGQLYHYWFRLEGSVDDPHLAILLPQKPADADVSFLDAMGIGLLWFAERGELVAGDSWLAEPLGISER